MLADLLGCQNLSDNPEWASTWFVLLLIWSSSCIHPFDATCISEESRNDFGKTGKAEDLQNPVSDFI